MIKSKLFIAIALYIILAIIAFVNFGAYDYIVARIEGGDSGEQTTLGKLRENVKNSRSVYPESFKESTSDDSEDDAGR